MRVLVVGAGVSGASVVRYLHNQGIAFDLVDEKPLSKTLAPLLAESTVFDAFDAELFCNYDVLILSPGIPRTQPAVAAALHAGVAVLGDIELFASVVDRPVIAVTGSNGKSTVVSWLAEVLQASGENIVLCGNIGEPALDSLSDSAALYVLELSSYQLESTTRLAPLAAVVLNVSDDHMDRYTSIEHYARVKRRIYRGCRHIVANYDDKRTWPESVADDGPVDARYAGDGHDDNHRPAMVRFFSLHDESNATYYLATEADPQWLCHGEQRLLPQSDLQVPGAHNVANALAIAALLEPLALDCDLLKKGLASFRGLPHRTQFITEHAGVRWYNDSKGTNVDACIKAINAMPGPVVLIAGGLGKGADFHALRSTVEHCVKALVLIGRDRQLMAAALQGAARVEFATSMVDAVQLCANLAQAGDVVLLSPACASFDMFRDFIERGERFSEAVEVLAA
jgi:UDP-N-acetylmuramoylalanine--D-glutamate ligase